jgi:transposase
MHVTAHQSIEQLQDLQDRATKPAMVLKLRAIILARRGWIAGDIAEAVGKSQRTIQQWVGDYNRQGLDGLKDRRGGNHRHLTDAQEQQLREHLDAQANDPQGGVRHAGALIPQIEQMFGVTYSLSGLYDLLHRLGYRWLMPRPRHEKNDPATVDAFKKTPRRLWSRSPRLTRANGSRSGSRTRPASASRAP